MISKPGVGGANSAESPENVFEVGTLHPKVLLLAEMGDLLVRWRAKLQCMLLWVRILSSRAYDGGKNGRY